MLGSCRTQLRQVPGRNPESASVHENLNPMPSFVNLPKVLGAADSTPSGPRRIVYREDAA